MSRQQGTITHIGPDGVSVRIGGAVMHRVRLASSLNDNDLSVGDLVALHWAAEDQAYATSVLEPSAGERKSPSSVVLPPPHTLVIRQAGIGASLVWQWDGPWNQLAFFEVDTALSPGGPWGYAEYPISEGTRTVHYPVTSESIYCRVRARGYYGNMSEWSPVSSVVQDLSTPPVPYGVNAKLFRNGVEVTWAGPTQSECPDLAGFNIYTSVLGTSSDATPVSTTGPNLRAIIDIPAEVETYVGVTAFDRAGNESDYGWCYYGGLAPTAPTDFTVVPHPSGVYCSWTGPTRQDVADLAGFFLYVTQDHAASGTGYTSTGSFGATGTGVSATDIGNVMSLTLSVPPGKRQFYNLRSYDTSGKVSDLAIDPWTYVMSGYGSGGQILTNADFERGWRDWNTLDMSGYISHQTSGGMWNTACMRAWLEKSDPDYATGLYWPNAYLTDIDVLGIDGAVYRLSAHIKPPPSYTMDEYMDEFSMHLSCHNGSYHGWGEQEGPFDEGYIDLGDGWYRVWADCVWTHVEGYDYIGCSFSFALIYGLEEYVYIDRVQLELGSNLTEFSLNTGKMGTTDGLSIDTAGIEGRYLSIAKDGTIDTVIANLLKSQTDIEATGDISIGGQITESTVVGCRVHNNTNISISSSVWTALTFDSERVDNDSIHSTSSNTDRLTAQRDGLYIISGHVHFDQSAVGTRGLRIRLNASNDIAVIWPGPVPDGTYDCSMSISTVYELSEGDYVTLEAFQTSGGSLDIPVSGNSSPEFAMARLV